MAHKKQGGKANQQVRRGGKHLGLKVAGTEKVTIGNVLIRQRGTKYAPGQGVKVGRDHTLYATKDGKVKFNKKLGKTSVSVV